MEVYEKKKFLLANITLSFHNKYVCHLDCEVREAYVGQLRNSGEGMLLPEKPVYTCDF